MAAERENAEMNEKKEAGVYIPAPTLETGHQTAAPFAGFARRLQAIAVARPAMPDLMQSRVPRGRCPRWIPCRETAGFFGFFRPKRAVAVLWNPPKKAKAECACQSSTFRFAFAEKRQQNHSGSLPFFILFGLIFGFAVFASRIKKYSTVLELQRNGTK